MKDDLTVRYEEILRLREELERLLARSKQSHSRKKSTFPQNAESLARLKSPYPSEQRLPQNLAKHVAAGDYLVRASRHQGAVRARWSRSPEIQFNGLAPFSVHAFLGHHALKALQQINHHYLIWTTDFFLLYLNASILGRRLQPASGPTGFLVRPSARRDHRRRSEHQNASD